MRASAGTAGAPEPIFVNLARFAALVGVHRNTVSTWAAEGMPSEARENETVVELAAGFQWIMARHKRELKELRERADPDGARTAKIAAEAKLREMDVAEREGKLVSADDVTEAMTARAVAVRESVMAIAGNAVQVGVIAPAQEAALEEICRDALTVLGKPLRPEAADPGDEEA